MAYYLFSPDGKPTTIASSLGSPEAGNPTTIPLDILRRFHFTFLIRHPRRSIPSYYRCTSAPLNEVTGWTDFTPSEVGYEELVRLFDFLLDNGIVDESRITVVDADDMLDNPESVIQQYCERVGLDFTPEMLEWSDDDREYASKMFAKWNGWHNDAIKSSHLRARSHAQKACTVESENEEWKAKYGPEAQKNIRAIVDANTPHYEYLRKFCLKV